METPDLLVLDSYSLGGRFATDCPVCSRKIIYQQSWALCNCPIFFHPQCFTSSVNNRDIKHQPKLKCLYCQQMYDVQYTAKAQIKCNKRFGVRQMGLLGVLALCISLCVFLGIQSVSFLDSESQQDSMKAIYMFVGMVLSLICATVVIGRLILVICFKQDISITGVKQVQRSIQFSAFKDIGVTQQNSDCMILH